MKKDKRFEKEWGCYELVSKYVKRFNEKSKYMSLIVQTRVKRPKNK